jgi:hypothetical protein
MKARKFMKLNSVNNVLAKLNDVKAQALISDKFLHMHAIHIEVTAHRAETSFRSKSNFGSAPSVRGENFKSLVQCSLNFFYHGLKGHYPKFVPHK